MMFQDIMIKAIKITDVNELGDVMISQLSSLFETKRKFH
jgi:cobaltochelatase CobT